jgi:hypothetical protein
VVRAGFEGDIGRCPAEIPACSLLESNDFGVVPSVIVMRAFPEYGFAASEYAADGGIGAGQADRGVGEF